MVAAILIWMAISRINSQPSPKDSLTMAKVEHLSICADDKAAQKQVADFMQTGAKAIRLQKSADNDHPTQWEVTGVFYQ